MNASENGFDEESTGDALTKNSRTSIKLDLERDQRSFEALKLGKASDEIDLDPPAEEAFGYLLNYQWYRKLRSLFLVSTYPRVHGPLFRSHYGVFQERARHLASYPWTVHPYSTFRWWWDILVSILLVVTLIGQPILITFYQERLRNKSHIIISCLQGWVFFMDIILNFRTGYVGSMSDTVTLDSGPIFWHYFKTWFFIDLLSTIPYDAIYLLFEGVAKLTMSVFNYLRLLELLKIFRTVRVIRYMTRIQEAYMIDSLYIRVINLHIVIFFTLHWIGCLHYLVAEMFNPPNNRNPMSWVTRMDLWDESVWIKYINAAIRAISNMACLGYGTEVPRTMEDILCTIFSIMVGATFFALFIGNLSSILINVDVSQKKYAEVLNQVLEYMRFKQIPRTLQNRVILYYEHRYRRNFFNETNILLSLSDVLRKELQMFNCRRLVEEVPLFHGMPAPVVQAIVGRLQFEVYLPQDIIIEAQSVGDSMYFIESGTVSVLASNGQPVGNLGEGDFFGEMALISKERRTATVIATSYCDMYRLEREDFEDAVMNYAEIYDKLVAVAQARAAKISKENATVPTNETANDQKPTKFFSRSLSESDDSFNPAHFVDVRQPTSTDDTHPFYVNIQGKKVNRDKGKFRRSFGSNSGSGSVSDIN